MRRSEKIRLLGTVSMAAGAPAFLFFLLRGISLDPIIANNSEEMLGALTFICQNLTQPQNLTAVCTTALETASNTVQRSAESSLYDYILTATGLASTIFGFGVFAFGKGSCREKPNLDGSNAVNDHDVPRYQGY